MDTLFWRHAGHSGVDATGDYETSTFEEWCNKLASAIAAPFSCCWGSLSVGELFDDRPTTVPTIVQRSSRRLSEHYHFTVSAYLLRLCLSMLFYVFKLTLFWRHAGHSGVDATGDYETSTFEEWCNKLASAIAAPFSCCWGSLSVGELFDDRPTTVPTIVQRSSRRLSEHYHFTVSAYLLRLCLSMLFYVFKLTLMAPIRFPY